jgi:Tol biopolymer transport system component
MNRYSRMQFTNMRLLIFGTIASLLARSADAQTQAVATREVRNVVPGAANVEQFVMTPDSQRTYYRPSAGGVWMYDRSTNATSQIMDAMVWDLALSPKKDVLAYTKVGDTRREQHVWIVPLSAATGLPAGKERKVSSHAGDVPSISPDGKRIAYARDDETGVGQTVVVVPVAGGGERVIAPAQPSSVSYIRWTPDGKTVYFGVNPPVPFTCAESCLSGAHETRPPSTIRRVGSTGGAVETIATVGLPGPGLSPDGKFVVFGDTGVLRRMIVADADGRRLKSFTLATPQTPVGWAGSSTLLTLATGQTRRLRTMPLPDGAPHVAFETNGFSFEPSWTPDGRSVAVSQFAGTGCELKVMNADGSAQRTIALAKTSGCVNVSWTSDQRWVVFTHYRGPNEKPVLMAVEAATGQSRELRTFADNIPQWVLDRDVVLVTESSRDGSGSQRAIWQVDLTGNAKMLREIPVDDGSSVTIVDRNEVIVMRKASRDFRLIALAGGEERTIAAATSGFVSPRPSLSPDRQWVGFLTGADNTKLTRLELVKLDQTARRTIDLPFSADAGGSFLVLAGGAGSVVGDRRVSDQPANVYFVNATANSTTKLFTYVVMGRPAELALSPDGRTVLYLLAEQLPPTVSAIDITTIR